VSAPSEDPTVALGPGRTVTRDRRTGAFSLSTSTLNAPLEALDRDELRRTRWFCYVSFTITVVAGAPLPWLGGDPAATVLLTCALVASAIATAFMLYRTRDPVRFARRTTALGWLVPAAATTAAIPYFGAFSPAPVILVLGIYFTGLGKNTRLAYMVYAVCAGVQGSSVCSRSRGSRATLAWCRRRASRRPSR
jgi:hypothetical protein